MCYILHSIWSLLLLVNTQGSLHCKQGSLLKHHLQLLWYNYETESTAVCNGYIPPWGVVVLHIGVGHSLGNVTLEERYERHSYMLPR